MLLSYCGNKVYIITCLPLKIFKPIRVSRHRISMSEDNIIKQNKNIPKELDNLINIFVNEWSSWTETTQKIIEEAKKNDIPMILVRKQIEFKMREKGMSDSTIRKRLPDELKDQSKVRAPILRSLLTTDDDKNRIEQSSSNITPPQTKEEEPDNNRAIIEVTESRPVIESEVDVEIVEPEPVKPPAQQPTRTKQILNSKMFPTEQWKVFSKREDCVFVATIENNQIKKIEVLGSKIAEKQLLVG